MYYGIKLRASKRLSKIINWNYSGNLIISYLIIKRIEHLIFIGSRWSWFAISLPK